MNYNSDLFKKIDAHIEANLEHWIEQLGRLCGQRSISAQNDGIVKCAKLVATMLNEQGFKAEIMPTNGHPVVYGEANGRSDKTLLFYLHYDVQPAEPLDLWESPPFELTRRGNHLFARGVSDDKGHIICRLAALAAIKEVLGELPCNVKFVIEGKEEVGSPNMPAFVETHQEKLATETAVSVYGSKPHITPIIGGSGPNYPFIHVFNLPVVTAGVGYSGSQAHAPNENLRIDYFVQGTKHTARIIEGFSRIS